MSLLVSICYLKFEIVFPAMSDQSMKITQLSNSKTHLMKITYS